MFNENRFLNLNIGGKKSANEKKVFEEDFDYENNWQKFDDLEDLEKEKMIKYGLLSERLTFDKIKNFVKNDDFRFDENKIILSNLYNLKNKKERIKAIDFLVDHYWNSDYLTDYENVQVLDFLGNFGKDAEDEIIKIMKKNLDFKKEENEEYAREDEFIQENIFFEKNDDIDENEFDYFVGTEEDDEGDLIDFDTKELVDSYILENNKVLDNLSKVGTKNSIDFLIEFVKNDEDSTYLYKEKLVNIFEKIDLNYAVSELLRLLKTDDLKMKERVSKIIFRLELGKQNISEKGIVEYLEKEIKLENLGEEFEKENKDLKESNLSMNRISSEGDCGVFDDDELVKIFKIGIDDLTNDEKQISKKVFDLSYQSLFQEKENESEEEREKRLGYLEDFKKNYKEIANEKIFSETNVKLNNLALKDQGWFVIFFAESSLEEREKLKDFVKKYGENGIRVFLSLEEGIEMGSDILEIGDNLEKQPELANQLFAEYVRIVDGSEQDVLDLEKMYNEVFIDEQKIDKNKAGYAVLKKGFELLKDALIKLKNCDEDKKNEIIFDLLLTRLLIPLFYLFKILSETK